MEERRKMISKKSALVHLKHKIKAVTTVDVINYLDAESNEVVKYRETVSEKNGYIFSRLCEKK